MSDEERNLPDETERMHLVKRFEEMVANNDSYFFDVDQFESILEYYLERNSTKEAEKVLSYAHDLFPASSALLLREAQLLASTGKVSNAIPKLKNLLMLEPNNDEALLTLASIYSQLREHKQSIEYFTKALACSDDDLKDDIYIDLALEYENLDRWNKAISVLHEALERNPENETALYELAYCYEMAGKLEECVHYYRKFIDEYPYSFPSWYNLGNVYQKLELLEDSIDAYDYCLAIQDDFTPAMFNKAHALVKMERYHLAIKAYQETLDFEPPQAATFCYIGECYERMDKLDQAEKFYKLSIEEDAHFSDAYVGLGVVADLRGETEKGMPFLERALELESENVEFHLLFGAALKKLNRHKEADESYLQALALEKDNPEVWIEYADNAYKQGDAHLALLRTEEAVQTIPKDYELTGIRASYLHACGLKEEAYVEFEALVFEDIEKCQSLLSDFPFLKDDLVVVQIFSSKKT
jgi:tetratricopeptide (TPR) repeat protein